MVSFVLELPGVDVNTRGRQGYTAIFYAMQLGDRCEPFIDLLVQHKADITMKDYMRGWTVIHWAVVLPLLSKGESIKPKAEDDHTTLKTTQITQRVLHRFLCDGALQWEHLFSSCFIREKTNQARTP